MQLPKNIFKSVLLTLGGCACIIAVFHVGVLVGYKKAMYSGHFGDNYERIFMGHRRNFMGENRGMWGHMDRPDFMGAHGLTGTILQVDGQTLILKDTNNTERSIVFSSSTAIRRMNENISVSNISTGTRAVIIGSPDEQGNIEAKLIRILPIE